MEGKRLRGKHRTRWIVQIRKDIEIEKKYRKTGSGRIASLLNPTKWNPAYTHAWTCLIILIGFLGIEWVRKETMNKYNFKN